ncbi:AN1-type zinc finger protein 4 [Nowakowskiella sp. JEL0078]|nr:AN1-type zinc finger protein 4 [Nowakowskiella sp. JEL0078]
MLELQMKDGKPERTNKQPIRIIAADGDDGDIFIPPFSKISLFERTPDVFRSSASLEDEDTKFDSFDIENEIIMRSETESPLTFYETSEEQDPWKNFNVSRGSADTQRRTKLQGYPATPRSKIRPATAISIMRTENPPTIANPKSRPVTAACHFKSTRSFQVSTPKKELKVIQERVESSQNHNRSLVESSARRNCESKSSKKTKSPDLKFFDYPETISVNKFDSDNQSTILQFETLTPKSRSKKIINRNSVVMKTPTPIITGWNTEDRKETLSSRKKRITTPNKKKSITPATINNKMRCAQCHKKIGLVTMFKCRCNQQYCSVHRLPEVHGCKFDYKEEGRAMLMKDNPLVKKDKVLKI